MNDIEKQKDLVKKIKLALYTRPSTIEEAENIFTNLNIEEHLDSLILKAQEIGGIKERGYLEKHMSNAMKNWTGTGKAMVEDYIKNLNTKDNE